MIQKIEQNYTKKVAYNTFVQIIGKIITTATSIVLIAALTRYLGVEGYGEFVTIFSYVSLFSVFADLGFYWIMVREISKDPDNAKNNHIVSNIMTMRTILGIIVFLTGFVISFLISKYDNTIRYGIGIISFGWLWTTLNSTYVGVFQAKHKMDRATITDIIGRLVILGLVLYFIKAEYGLLAITFAYSVGNIINFFLNLVLGWKIAPFKFSFDFPLWKTLFYESLPMGIVLLFNVVYIRLDSIILSLMRTPEDVGIYGAPNKILEILVLVPAIFMGNIFPIITKYFNEKNPKIYEALQKSFDFIIILVFPIVIGVYMLSTPIMHFIAGEQFIEASTIPPIFGHPANSAMVLRLLIFTTGIIYIQQIFSNTIVAIGKQKKLILPNLIVVVVNVLLNIILIPKLSYIGASIATIVTQIILCAVSYHIVHKYLPKIQIRLYMIGKALISSLVMGLVIYLLYNLNMFIVITISIPVYFVALYFIGGINKQMLSRIISK